MVRRYKTTKWMDSHPRPADIWGKWQAVLKGDASEKEIQAFVDECLFATVEGNFIPLDEKGYKGTCIDFIFDNRERMPRYVLSQLLGSSQTWVFDPSAPMCTTDGSRIPCYGKIIDYAYEELDKKKDDKLLRDAAIGYVVKKEVDLSAPLCKMPSGEAVACMQKVLDDAKSTTAIELKMGSGQSIIPALKAECRTIGDNTRTSCIDKVFDNMIEYGADRESKKYQFADAKLYQSLVRSMCSYNAMSGIYDLLQENMFYDKWIEEYVSGYDKILRRLSDRAVNRTALNNTIQSLVEVKAINYEKFAGNPEGCYHPFTEKQTTCLDAAFAIMHDRAPDSETTKKYPKSSARRFDTMNKLISDAARYAKFEDQTCTAIPQAGQGWSEQKTNCISSVLAVPSDELMITVFDPTRLTSIVSKQCRYVTPDGITAVNIPCFEAVLRTSASRISKSKTADYAPVIRGIVLTQGVDLSKPCNNINFTDETSCLDLLMDLDVTNASVDNYLSGAIKTKDLSAFKCSISKSTDVSNAFDLSQHYVANPAKFMTKIMNPTGETKVELESSIRVSCLDKVITSLHAQKLIGFQTVYQGTRNTRGGRDYPPDYAKIGLSAVSGGGSTKGDAQCRYIYPDENGEPAAGEIPCYQKFIEVFMPPDSPGVGGLAHRQMVPSGFDIIHEIFDDFDMSKPCKLYNIPSGVVGIGESRTLPCIAAMYMKYGADHVLFLGNDGKTRARDIHGNVDDLRCSIIGSKHFGKVTESMKKITEDPAYRDYVSNFKMKMCNNLSCRSKPGAEDGIDTRSKGKLGKIMYCHCDEHVKPDGTFTPEAATCFEKACYSTVAAFGTGPMWDDFRRFYRAGDQIPPIVRYTHESMPDNMKIVDDISGVYEVKPRFSPHDFHVRRYITEFSKVMDKVYETSSRNPISLPVRAVNQRKLFEITGKSNMEEAIAAARNLSAEQMSEIDAGDITVPAKISIALYFKKDGKRVDIPANVVKKATNITEFILEGKETEVYTKRPEWNPRNISSEMKESVNAITEISKAYVESDDKNIYIEITYKDSGGKVIQNFTFDEDVPSKSEISLSKAQLSELRDKKEINIGDKVVKVRYNLFAKEMITPFRLSRLMEVNFLGSDVKDQIAKASRIAAGMPETPMKVVITTDPRDIMRASTCQRWGSCIKLEDGGRENTQSVASYIKAGSYIAYITDDLNNPIWKGRTLIHRSTIPKLLAVQDRWTRDCGTEYVYGMPEFRRLLLDTIRVVIHSKGYNNPEVRKAAGTLPPYLFTDYFMNPSKYIMGHPEFEKICKSFISFFHNAGQWVNKDQCVPGNQNFNDFIRLAGDRQIGNRDVDGIVESIHNLPWVDVEHTHGNPDRRGIECGPSQEFRAITDDDISEIVKYRGEDFVKSLGKYVRPYPTKEIL